MTEAQPARRGTKTTEFWAMISAFGLASFMLVLGEVQASSQLAGLAVGGYGLARGLAKRNGG